MGGGECKDFDFFSEIFGIKIKRLSLFYVSFLSSFFQTSSFLLLYFFGISGGKVFSG